MRAGTAGNGSRIRTSRASFALGPVFGAREDLGRVRFGEVRAKHKQAGEVELAARQSVEQRREASDETSGGNASESLVFREAELINTVDV